MARLGCAVPGGSDASFVKAAHFFSSNNFAQLEAGILDPPFTPDVSGAARFEGDTLT